MEEIDVWRFAQQLMTLHGADAALVATDLADARFADGNVPAFRVWRRAVSAINELNRTKPCGCERLS